MPAQLPDASSVAQRQLLARMLEHGAGLLHWHFADEQGTHLLHRRADPPAGSAARPGLPVGRAFAGVEMPATTVWGEPESSFIEAPLDEQNRQAVKHNF
jgi:hypothetical protein